jgi:glycosyltransferase involved in cell wall biosynthesis
MIETRHYVSKPVNQWGGIYSIGKKRKISLPGQPLITIITVVFNGQDTLNQAIESILSQTYSNIDFFIIDGGSHDDTINIIKSKEAQISLWLSEKDNGIFYAMNKAIDLIEDEDSYVLFINADDYLADTQVIERVASQINNHDFIYGKVMLKSNELEVPVGELQTRNSLSTGMIQHQATFTRKSIFTKFGYFDTGYKIVSDYEFAVRVFSSNSKTLFINQVVSVMRMGGVSSTLSTFKEKKKVLNEYYTGGVLFKSILKINLVEIPRNFLSVILNKAGVLKYWRAFRSKVYCMNGLVSRTIRII